MFVCVFVCVFYSVSRSTGDFQRPVSVFSETSIESSMSAPNYSSFRSPRHAGTLPRPNRLQQASVEERERSARLNVGIYHFNRYMGARSGGCVASAVVARWWLRGDWW